MMKTEMFPEWAQGVLRDEITPIHTLRDETAASQLFWTDAESGEQLSIELVCSRELVADLVAHGFEVRPAHATYAPQASCRITTGL